MEHHETIKPDDTLAGIIPNGVTEVDNGRERKRLQHDADHLSSQRGKRCGRSFSYSLRKGPRKSGKKLRNLCPMTCRKKCQTLISQEKCQEIVQSYWEIENVQGQWQFINSNITIIGKSRTHANVSLKKSRRQNRRAFRLDGKEVRKVMFLNTLTINDRVIETAIDKLKNGYTEEDNRGKTGSITYPEAVLKTVKNYIKKFSVTESHYMREKSKRQFLTSNLNIHLMYELHQSEKEVEVKVGEEAYRNVLNTCFNLNFHKPEKRSLRNLH